MFTVTSHFTAYCRHTLNRTHVSYYGPYYKKLPLSQVLIQTQKDLITSSDHKANIRAIFDKSDCQGEGKNIETLDRTLCASYQGQTVFKGLTNGDQPTLDPCTIFTGIRKSCAHKC